MILVGKKLEANQAGPLFTFKKNIKTYPCTEIWKNDVSVYP